jgi:alpha-beta hydrolase superfamily lysophospholipase
MKHTEDYYIGLKNFKIFYQSWVPENPKAVVQIIHGGFEHIGRYRHVIERLTSDNFIIYGNDHRGHGKSEGKRNHIKSFDEYMEDNHTLTKMIKKNHPGMLIFLLGHSMGSCVAQRYAINYQEEINGLILSGSGTGIGIIPIFLRIVAKIMARIYPTFKAASNLDPDELSHDPESIADYTSDPLINYKKATAAMGLAFMNHYPEIKERISKVNIPVLIQKGALDETVVGIDELITDLKTEDKTVKIYENGKHEMYNEIKEKREVALTDLVNWLNSHL